MSEQDPQKEPEQTIPHPDAGFTHMFATAIQINELYKNLVKAGFSKNEAIQLSGIVLSSGVLYRYDQYDEFDEEDDSELDDTDGEDFA